jgi:hypothetical protein
VLEQARAGSPLAELRNAPKPQAPLRKPTPQVRSKAETWLWASPCVEPSPCFTERAPELGWR